MVKKLPKFEMRFEPMTIEHLGLKLYSTLPPVISEFVSNAYDAEAPKVEIFLPEGKTTPSSEVIIRDFGHGMSADELNDEFLWIGRKRRGEDSKNIMSKNGKRRVTGRKGLGKLSAFGVAHEIDVRAIKSGFSICLRLNYEEMQNWVEKHGKDNPYNPQVVDGRTGETKEHDGVEVTLRQLHRSKAISDDIVRKGLAERLHFIGPDFQVLINGKPIGPGDRSSQKDCILSWEIKELPLKGNIGDGLALEGWIGFVEKSSQEGRGIDIFAAGKAVELGSFFHFSSTHAQYARAYLIGQVHADFLDEDVDLIATARNSVVWESDIGQRLEEWGHKTLKWAFDQWLDKWREKKQTRIINETGFATWIEERNKREQKIARKMVSLLIENEDLTSESAKPLLEIIKSSVESVAFHDLVDAIKEEGGTSATLLKLFDEWKVIEAREHLKLAYGRLGALDQLEKFINEGALEVRQMQPLLAQNPWIIDPAWTETSIERTYTALLAKYAKETDRIPKEDRRIDIWGVRAGTSVTIVELKRPQKTLAWKDLDQIEHYVLWARGKIAGTGPHAPRYANGLLVVGDFNKDGDIQRKMEHLAGLDIRVETFRDLYRSARGYYDELDRRLQTVAPEYSIRLKREREKKAILKTPSEVARIKPTRRK